MYRHPSSALYPTGINQFPGSVPKLFRYSDEPLLPQIPRIESANSNINNRTKDRPFKFNPYQIWEDQIPPNLI